MFQVHTLVMTDIKQPGTFLYPVTKLLQCFGSLPAQLLQINFNMFQHLHILNNELKYFTYSFPPSCAKNSYDRQLPISETGLISKNPEQPLLGRTKIKHCLKHQETEQGRSELISCQCHPTVPEIIKEKRSIRSWCLLSKAEQCWSHDYEITNKHDYITQQCSGMHRVPL